LFEFFLLVIELLVIDVVVVVMIFFSSAFDLSLFFVLNKLPNRLRFGFSPFGVFKFSLDDVSLFIDDAAGEIGLPF
jgi:hypothetical protein